jgi:pyruvate/2-oxoglutarate dehydrogenase complex dihydrolipoamide dehydrogenase (E3) component
LERQLGLEIGAVFRWVHEKQGVVFHLGEEVAAIEGEGRAERVRLESGRVLAADLVVVGLGIVPATGFLPPDARRQDHGIDVDAHLRLAEGHYAAGDVAAFPLYGTGDRIRVEHWRVAEQHGRVAALNMLGRAVNYTSVPYFWTIHYRQRLDYVGHAECWDEVIIDGDLREPKFIAFYVQAGVVKAVAGWGRDHAMAAVIPLMTERHDWTTGALCNALRVYA